MVGINLCMYARMYVVVVMRAVVQHYLHCQEVCMFVSCFPTLFKDDHEFFYLCMRLAIYR